MAMISALAITHGRTRDVNDQHIPALTVVLHITGRATYQHAEAAKLPPLKHLSSYFNEAGNPFAHYSVDPWGRIACHAYETETPQAQGWAELGGIAKVALLKPPAWWVQFNQGYTSLRDPSAPRPVQHPIDLLPPGTRTPNERSIAIEFIQYGNQFLLTEAQYTYGHRLVADVCRRHQIPMQRPWVRGHEDVNPWSRGGKRSGGWDPGAMAADGSRFSWVSMLTVVQPGDLAVLATPPMPDWAV